jgi:hypothetical protein
MQRVRQAKPAWRLAAGAAALAATWAAGAATLSAPFLVTVTYNPAPGAEPGATAESAFCVRSDGAGPLGAAVTVVCRTGAFVAGSPTWIDAARAGGHLPGTAHRPMAVVTREGAVLGTVDADAGRGVLTRWRLLPRQEAGGESAAVEYEMGIAW